MNPWEVPAVRRRLGLDKLRDDVQDYYYGTPLVNGKIERSLRRINYNNLTDNVYAGTFADSLFRVATSFVFFSGLLDIFVAYMVWFVL